VNDELESGRKRPWPNLMCYPRIFLEELKKTSKSLSHDGRYPGRDLNPGPPEYEGVLTTPPRHSVFSHCSLQAVFIYFFWGGGGYFQTPIITLRLWEIAARFTNEVFVQLGISCVRRSLILQFSSTFAATEKCSDKDRFHLIASSVSHSQWNWYALVLK
jgi:hypothetical protein